MSACTTNGPTPAASLGTATQTATVTPATTADTDAALIESARAYAAAARIEVATMASPIVDARQPEFDEGTLRLVGLPLTTHGDPAMLGIYFDAAGEIRVISDGLAFARAVGRAVSRDGAIAAAGAAFGLVGMALAPHDLTVVKGEPGQAWYITLNRAIDGYPVANHPLAWGIAGDKAWVTLRSDGTLVDLYAIRPANVGPDAIKPIATLTDKLAAVSGLATSDLLALEPQLTWARARDPQTQRLSAVLTLNYCATRERPTGWSTWCIDSSTGATSLQESGSD